MDNQQNKKQVDLYVFDFDYTVIEENSDTIFYTLFEGSTPPKELADKYVVGQWTKFMNTTLDYLKNNMNISDDKIKEEVEKSKLTGGMKELFQRIKNKNGEIIICSDANSLFIKWIVEKNNLAQYITEIYTNPCHIENNQLHVRPFYETHDCQNCTQTPNMCKNKIINEHIAKNPQNSYDVIHYFGDGKNDFCPILHLKNSNSSGNVRKGFTLEKKIQEHLKKEDHQPFQCTLRYWSQATEILEFF